MVVFGPTVVGWKDQFWNGGVSCDSDQGRARSFPSPRPGFRSPGQARMVNSGRPRVCQESANIAFRPSRRITSYLWRHLVCCLVFRGYTGHETETTAALVVADGVRKGKAVDPKIEEGRSAACRPWHHEAGLKAGRTADPPIPGVQGGRVKPQRWSEGETSSFDRHLGYAFRGVNLAGIERPGLGSTPAVNRVAFNSESILNAGTPSLVISGFEADKRSRPCPQPAGPLCGRRVSLVWVCSSPIPGQVDEGINLLR